MFSRELYTTLIEPASRQLQGVKTICIVPDRVLWNLPFQALMLTSAKKHLEIPLDKDQIILTPG